jgi:dTDP-glucose 4,6-dehydratase
MKIVVTGAAGFIASYICKRLVERGDEVVGLDNLCTGSVGNILHLLGNDRFHFVEHDVNRPFSIAGPVDAVMHLASPASPKDYFAMPIETLKVGSLATFHSLDLAKDKDARFFFASTSEVYGDPHVHPQPESYWGNVNSVGVRSVYDEAKRFGEAATMAYHREHGLDVRISRTFNTYGPRMRPEDGRVVSNFLVQALAGKPLTVYGDGSQTRSFCYVDDQASGLIGLLDSSYVGPVNIGNPEEFTMLELAAAVLEVTNSESDLVFEPLPSDDPTQRRPDISLAKREFGWVPTIRLLEGLERTAAWFASTVPVPA